MSLPTTASMQRPPRSLKSRALACIAQREHSRVELQRKLLASIDRDARRRHAVLAAGGLAEPMDVPPTAADVEQLLDWLTEKDLLSSTRFVDTRVQARLGRFGNVRIQRELAQHGLQADADLAHQLRHSELHRARAVWAKRFGAPASDAAGRAKQMRFLIARGFSAEVVRRVVGGDDDGDDAA